MSGEVGPGFNKFFEGDLTPLRGLANLLKMKLEHRAARLKKPVSGCFFKTLAGLT